MAYDVIVTDVFRDWYENLLIAEQRSIQRVVGLLIDAGPALKHPYSSGINGSRFSHMRASAFNMKAVPIGFSMRLIPNVPPCSLVGGVKMGDDRWYEKSHSRGRRPV